MNSNMLPRGASLPLYHHLSPLAYEKDPKPRGDDLLVASSIGPPYLISVSEVSTSSYLMTSQAFY